MEVGEEYADLSRQQKQCSTQGQHGSLLRVVVLPGVMGKVLIWKSRFETSGDARETVVKSGGKHRSLS